MLIRSTSVIFCISVAPALIYMVYGSKDLRPETWTSVETSDELGPVDAPLLISWVMWVR